MCVVLRRVYFFYMFAIQKAYLDGSLGKGKWSNNIIAGLVVGVVALPLAMAFAIASGVTPQAGIYTAIIAGIFVSLFGGSPVQIAGPTGAFIVLLSSIVVNYGFEGLQIATMMAGVILVLMSVAKLGTVIRFIQFGWGNGHISLDSHRCLIWLISMKNYGL